MTNKNKPTNGWGFDTRNIDTSVRPQDNFYLHANGNWLKRTKIPKDESRWGSFITLSVDTEHQLKNIVETLVTKKNYPKGSSEQMVSDYYRAAIDMKARNTRGSAPIAPLLKKVNDVQHKDQLLKLIAELHVLGISAFWGAGVDQDSKDNTSYIMHVAQSGLGLPDRDYYLLQKPEQTRVRNAYLTHIEKLSRLIGKTAQEALKTQETVMRIETKLAKASMKKEDLRDPEKTYFKKTLAQVQQLSPAIDWKKYFTNTGAPKVAKLIVCQPLFFTFVSKLITETSLDELKTYVEWHIVNECAGMLSDKFVKENFAFYGTVLSGTKVMKPLWRRALGATNGALGEALGKIYVTEHFPPSSKKIMNELVDDLFAAYAIRIKQVDWMSPSTKQKAIVKLKSLHRKIGYPSVWKGYKGMSVTPDDYVGNAMRSSTFEHHRNMKKLGKPIDRNEWHMYPQTVNAYYSPNMGDIVFPAAILQWPFFDPKADAALNYASIGSIIGHEITHGFDDQGAKFDAKGNMRMWWTQNDVKKFTAKTKPFIAQANKECVIEEVYINGQLTLGENMADSGGLSIAYDAYQKHLAKKGREILGGLTPEERFFYAFAQQECELRRPEFQKMVTLTDPHAPAFWRINGPLSNFEPFIETFRVVKGDSMYRDPKSRSQIW